LPQPVGCNSQPAHFLNELYMNEERAEEREKMKSILMTLFLPLLLGCSFLSGGKIIKMISVDDYLKDKRNTGGLCYECNPEKVLITENENMLLMRSKDFVDSIGIPFFINILDSQQVIFRWESDPSLYPKTQIYANLTLKNLGENIVPSSLKKITFSLIPLENYRRDGNEPIQLARAPGTGPDSAVVPTDTSELDKNEIEKIKAVLEFIHTLHSEYSVQTFQFERRLEIYTGDRNYLWNPKEIINCDPKEDFCRFHDKWFIRDYQAHRKLKQYDKKDPYPYSVIDTEDSIVTKYRVKEDVVVKKPCNVRDAHDKIEEILKAQGISIKENTDMIDFHFGLGMWMRNNWGLWSGKSRLVAFFASKEIAHPDDMSAYILDTYKERAILKKNHPDSLDNFYQSIGDIECERQRTAREENEGMR